MKDIFYLIIGRTGIRGTRKTKPPLKWDEISVKVSMEFPDVLFQRPLIEAKITVDKDMVLPETINPDIVINTKELIEQSTGCKIDFKVIKEDKEVKI
ncbi:MAG: hypothetical protein IMZ51_03880 [Chloroflexi bacterium]|nr:hypothetical protein [Chloroflexota bacterium]